MYLRRYSKFFKSISFGFCQKQLTEIVSRGYCLVNDYPRSRGQEAVDRLDMVGHFDFCTRVEVNLITKVLF